MSKRLLLVALGVCAGSAYSLPALRPKGLRTRHTLHAPTTHALVAAATPAAGDDAPPAAELRGGASGEPGGTLVLLGAVVMLFVACTAASSAGIVPIQKELGLSASTVGVLQSAYLAGYALTNAPGGAIADRAGAVMLAPAWSVAVALMPVAAASPAPVAALVALRLLFGLASGPALPGSLAVVSRWLPLAKRSSGIADVFVFFNAGNAAGLLLGGLIPVGQLAALTHVHNCLNWSFFFMQAWLPTHSQELGLELSKSAGLSALPMVTMALGSKVGGQAATRLIAEGWAPFDVRRLMIAISPLIPARSSPSAAWRTRASPSRASSSPSGPTPPPRATTPTSPTSRQPGQDPRLHETVGVFVGIVANVVTGRVLEATAFRACFALAAAIYASEFAVFFGFVRGGRLV
ncbi:hypothetical protein JL720_6141 [Aureococcus anophagefferens]|nr:hypothetical protein JL720_6141 [Aureococcus anophagefferens]